MTLTKDDILKAEDCKAESVPIPEWGGDVLIAVMSAEDADAFMAMHADLDGRSAEDSKYAEVLARMAQTVLVDDKGEKLFTPDDVPALRKKGFVPLQAVMEAGLRVNGMDEESQEQAVKN